MISSLDAKAEELYFVYKPIEGEDRGPGPVALLNVKFNSR